MKTSHLLGLALAALLPAAAPAQEAREKIKGFARDIERICRDEKQTAVAVGEFTGPTNPATGAGPMVQAILCEELAKLKIDIRDDAFVVAKGEFFPLDPDKAGSLTLRLECALRTTGGRKLDTLTADIGFRGNTDIVKLLGISTSLEESSKADREKQNEKIKVDMRKPPVAITGTRIKTFADSKFACEILTCEKGAGDHKACAPGKTAAGLPQVVVKRGEEYVIRLHNDAAFECAVSVTIDGLDCFHFYDEAGRKPAFFIVPAGGTREVKGWVRSTSKVNAFLVGSFADSLAAKVLKSSGKVGVVTCCFHPCWEKDKPPPAFEGTRAADPDATNLGREIESKSRLVPRTVGPLLTAISVRYTK